MRLTADLKGVLVIPESISNFDSGMIYDQQNVKKIVFNTQTAKIDDGAFKGWKNLEEVKFPPASACISIGNGAFEGCDKLKKIVLPPSLRIIGGAAFKDCRALEKAYIPMNTQVVGAFAFGGCLSLTEITIANSDTLIKSKAFVKCIKLYLIRVGKTVYNVLPFYNYPALVLFTHEAKGCRFFRLQALRAVHGGEIIGTKYYGCVGQDMVFGEGDTVRESYEDYLFLLAQRKGQEELRDKCTASTLINSDEYRMLAGSCRFGVRAFCLAHGIEISKEKKTIRDLTKLLETIKDPDASIRGFIEWAHTLPDFNV